MELPGGTSIIDMFLDQPDLGEADPRYVPYRHPIALPCPVECPRPANAWVGSSNPDDPVHHPIDRFGSMHKTAFRHVGRSVEPVSAGDTSGTDLRINTT